MQKRVIASISLMLVLILFFSIPLFSLMQNPSTLLTGNVVKEGTEIKSSEKCSDSDGGIFSRMPGKVLMNSTKQKAMYDECQSFNLYVGKTTKTYSYLLEGYCKKGIRPERKRIYCENGCSNGACL